MADLEEARLHVCVAQKEFGKTKIHFLISTQILDFSYEKLGEQSDGFKKNVFIWVNEKGAEIPIQIIAVQKTSDEIQNLYNQSRPRVPTLPHSDLDIVEIKKKKAAGKESLTKTKKKERNGNIKASRSAAAAEIIKQHSQTKKHILNRIELSESSEDEELHEQEVNNLEDNDSHVSESEASNAYAMEAADAANDSAQDNSSPNLPTKFPGSKRRLISETSCDSSSSNPDSPPEENIGPSCSRILKKKKSARFSAPTSNTKRMSHCGRVGFEQRAVSEQIPLRNERRVQNQIEEAAEQIPVAAQRIPLRYERPVENQRGLAANALPVGVMHNQALRNMNFDKSSKPRFNKRSKGNIRGLPIFSSICNGDHRVVHVKKQLFAVKMYSYISNPRYTYGHNYVCMHSGYRVRHLIFDSLKDENNYSTFIRLLCVGLWGHKTLASKCVKKNHRSPELVTELEPNKILIIKEHTRYLLHRMQATNRMYINVMIKKFNKYLGTAISESTKIMKKEIISPSNNPDVDNVLTDSGDEL